MKIRRQMADRHHPAQEAAWKLYNRLFSTVRKKSENKKS